MAAPIKAIVKPELLVWARQSAGYSVEEAAAKINVKPERLQRWENGEDRPTISQLRNLGKIYKRPIAVFYLPEPPRKFQSIKDFRRLPGVVVEADSPQLLYEIRRAQERREAALELIAEIGHDLPVLEASASLSEEPADVGARVRKLLGITRDQQLAWANGYQAMNDWRTALERAGTLVFQAASVSTDEMRGFSISEFPLPVIVVNIKEPPTARIFSMVHEFVHLLLRRGGLCDLREDSHRPPEEQEVEVFCNAVAGEVLVPRSWLLAEPTVREHRTGPVWSMAELGALARRFSVSREVIARRLLTLDLTVEPIYKQIREELQSQYVAKEKPDGFVTPDVKAVATVGFSFARLVLDSYYQEKITSSEVSDLLEVRLKHLAKIERRVFGRSTPPEVQIDL